MPIFLVRKLDFAACEQQKLSLFQHLCYLGLDARKPVFGVSDQVKSETAFSVTKTSQNFEILYVASWNIVFFR